ncbi:precorrin 3B synthase CobZ [Cladophialophora immunda]|uniref:Precorrin 3B synthase CobZ n=1 Tax=Cladophialophora immunda TaxID=569365 RepID=A0A0D2CVY4_9EURO|nr:precorrin 3B synthase CobZ [Cladophialophora immunda]KIW35263.1 precorrin 3B synthase CobZ [Cladophialophora immunda]
MSLPAACDVLVVGSGNAGFAAALSASQSGAKRILLIDKCPESWAGGNSYFTAGAYRTVHHGLNDLLPIVNNVDAELAGKIDLDPYTEKDFSDDMHRICGGRSNPELSTALIKDSNSAIKWLAQNGVRFQLSFNRQAYEVNGRFKFWGGLHLKTQDGGKGLIEDYLQMARRQKIALSFNTALTGLSVEANGRVNATVHRDRKEHTIKAGAVILAAGGFEASPRLRCQYLGPGWDMALVRGTPFNTGDCLEIAMRDVSALAAGNWSGCHSVAWDANADPNTGDRLASNEYTKSGYPLGVMINTQGKRFVDEGVDLRNYTYAIFGRAILAQPESVAFQVWDSRTSPWLRTEEYREERVERITANTIEELADKCAQRGLRNRESFISTLREYNEAVYAHRQEHPTATWNPAIKDGLSTQSSTKKLALAKSNWALPIDQGPFLAVKVSCGVTFTFGGLSVNPETAQLKSAVTREGIPGVYCIGEMLGGLFYSNYPGGSGLTSGAVFGRRAGKAAAQWAARSSLQTGQLAKL